MGLSNFFGFTKSQIGSYYCFVKTICDKDKKGVYIIKSLKTNIKYILKIHSYFVKYILSHHRASKLYIFIVLSIDTTNADSAFQVLLPRQHKVA